MADCMMLPNQFLFKHFTKDLLYQTYGFKYSNDSQSHS